MAHQCQQIVFRVAKRSQPEIVSSHISDKDRLFLDFDAALGKCGAGCLNVFDVEIDYGARVIEFRFRRQRQHQSNSVAVEESEVWGHTEKVLHAELVAIEGGGPLKVVDVHRDLFDCGKTKTC